MKLLSLLQAEQALNRLGEEKVNLKSSYHVAKLTKLVKEETKFYYEEHKKFIEELGEKRDVTEAESKQGMTGPVYEVKSDKLEEFQTKMKELGDIEIAIDKWKLTMKILEDFKVSSNEILALDELLIETEE